MKRSRPVSLALVGLFLWLTACTSYKQIEPTEVADYDEVRVTFSDGEQVVLKDVTVEGDSIYYWEKVEQPAQYAAVRVSSPLDQVVEAEVRGGGTGGIVLVVGVSIVAALAVAGVILCASDDYLC